MALSLEQDGAQHLPGAALALLPDLIAHADAQEEDAPGQRLTGPALQALVAPGGPLQQIATAHIGVRAKAVRAILFEKSERTNWALGWHQDRVITLQASHAVAGFGPWTVKAGIPHVAPPFDLLATMLTMRVHLDAVPADNGPLLIAPGSHRLGRVAAPDIAEHVAQRGTFACIADAGDVWLYATPILHASERAAPGSRRRVLQLDFSAEDLPPPLKWYGV